MGLRMSILLLMSFNRQRDSWPDVIQQGRFCNGKQLYLCKMTHLLLQRIELFVSHRLLFLIYFFAMLSCLCLYMFVSQSHTHT